MQSRKSDSAYLDSIDGATQEKAGMCEYLDGLGRTDLILEIGPGGGGAVKELLEHLKKVGSRALPKVYVVDCNSAPLERVKKMAEEINSDLDAINRIRVRTFERDAKKLSFLNDGCVSLVNISSILHEIYSYSGGDEGIDQFIRELARVVKMGGIVTYRDPEGKSFDSYEAGFISAQEVRMFMVPFLHFFFHDNKWKKTDVNKKYLPDLAIKIDGHKVNFGDLSIKKLIDAKTVLVNGPGNLKDELLRHYVVFMKWFFPQVFMTIEQEDSQDAVKCRFQFKPGEEKFKTFCEKRDINYKKLENEGTYSLSRKDANLFKSSTKEEINDFFGETYIGCESAEIAVFVQDFLVSLLIPSKVSPGSTRILLPFESLITHFSHISGFSKEYNLTLRSPQKNHDAYEWFNGEARESYYYGDAIDILEKFVRNSLKQEDTKSSAGYSCLVPISPDMIQLVQRTHYANYVRGCVIDIEGNYNDGKRIIHFMKKPVHEAFGVLSSLYQANSDPRLRALLDELLKVMKQSLDNPISRPGGLTEEEAQFREKTGEMIAIGISGGIAAGKATAGEVLARQGFLVFELSSIIRRQIEDTGVFRPSKSDFFEIANTLRQTKGNDYLARKAIETFGPAMNKNTAIIGIRTPEEVQYFRSIFKNFVLVAVTAPHEDRVQRVKNRLSETSHRSDRDIVADMKREMKDSSEGGCQLANTLKMADYTIDNSKDRSDLEKACLKKLENIIDDIPIIKH